MFSACIGLISPHGVDEKFFNQGLRLMPWIFRSTQDG